MIGRQEAVATCSGEQVDSRTGTQERTDWDCEQRARATRLFTDLRCARWNQTETGSSGSAGAAGSWRC